MLRIKMPNIDNSSAGVQMDKLNYAIPNNAEGESLLIDRMEKKINDVKAHSRVISCGPWSYASDGDALFNVQTGDCVTRVPQTTPNVLAQDQSGSGGEGSSGGGEGSSGSDNSGSGNSGSNSGNNGSGSGNSGSGSGNASGNEVNVGGCSCTIDVRNSGNNNGNSSGNNSSGRN